MEVTFQLVISGRGETEDECKQDVADIIYDMMPSQIDRELMFDAIAQAGYSEKYILAVIRLKLQLVDVLTKTKAWMEINGGHTEEIYGDIHDVLDKAEEVKI